MTRNGNNFMKVKDLISLLQDKDPEINVLMLLKSACYNDTEIQHVKSICRGEYHTDNSYEIEIVERGTECVFLSDD